MRSALSKNVRLAPLAHFSASAQPGLATTTEEPDKLYKILELELRGHDPAVLKSFAKFATTAGNHLDVQSKRLLSLLP